MKIRGHRVELGEIEFVLRNLCGADGVIAVPWPKTPSGYGGVEAFMEGEVRSANDLREAVAFRLPDYMIPRRFPFHAQASPER